MTRAAVRPPAEARTSVTAGGRPGVDLSARSAHHDRPAPAAYRALLRPVLAYSAVSPDPDLAGECECWRGWPVVGRVHDVDGWPVEGCAHCVVDLASRVPGDPVRIELHPDLL